MIIGFDLDGTVVDSPQQVVHYINERLGLSLTMDDFKTYSMEDALPQQYKWIVDNNNTDNWILTDKIRRKSF